MKKILAILLLLPLVCSAEIYKYQDEKGYIYYTDQPQPGAKKVELRPTTVTRKDDDTLNSKDSSKKTTDKAAAEKDKKEDAVKEYRIFSIADPVNQQTFQNTRLIPVTIKVEPELFEGDKVTVLLDGQEVMTQAATQFIINNPNRGTHTVTAKLINANGQVLKTSNSVTIYVHYSTLNNPTRSKTNGN